MKGSSEKQSLPAGYAVAGGRDSWPVAAALLLLVLAPGPWGLSWAAASRPPGDANRAARPAAPLAAPAVVLYGLGDSLTHGTMDGTNNAVNTRHAYLQLTADSLRTVTPLIFSQPLFDDTGERIAPLRVPTNLGVDGANIFTAEGIEYYKRVGAPESYITDKYLCDHRLPGRLEDKYDRVLYPINLLARAPVSQVDAALELLSRPAPGRSPARPVFVFWLGNNESSLAALGEGGANPAYYPIPFDQIKPKLSPTLAKLLEAGEASGDISFEPYTPSAIARNLTDLADFEAQLGHVFDRLKNGAAPDPPTEFFVLTLPYYSAVGYLFDSEDLEFYLKKINPAYTVPPTFARVAAPGEPITEPFRGDRVSLFTFGLMYALLWSGYPVDYVNTVLESDGVQADGLVLSEAEQRTIMERIDGFNRALAAAAAAFGPRAHLVDAGGYMNRVLSGQTTVVVGGRTASRKWVRGNSFSLDGVHPGYTGQALVANYLLAAIGATLGLTPPTYDLDEVWASDVYIDRDGDGWAPGPDYQPSGIPELLFFFKDPDDANAEVQVELPPDVWETISRVLLRELLGGLPRLPTATGGP